MKTINILGCLMLMFMFGCGGGGGEKSAVLGSTFAPPTPTGVTATAGDKQNSISWNSSPGATGYNIYWSTNAALTTATKIPNVTAPYPHAGLTNGTTYFYIVTAFNAIGESMPSSVQPATIGLTAKLVGTDITLSWRLVTGAIDYEIFYISGQGNNNVINPDKTSNTTYPYTGLSKGDIYVYSVTAYSATQEVIVSENVTVPVPIN